MDLIINGHLIDAPIIEILNQVKRELTNGKLRDIQPKGDDILVTCPHHKGGHENNPSCGVYASRQGDVEYGSFHCFTCNSSGPLWHFIAECFEESDSFGKEWLLERFGNTLIQSDYGLMPSIDLNKPKEEVLDESVLDHMQSYHPYLASRGISEDTCKRFNIKYDPLTDCVVFPLYDKYGKLKNLTRRRVSDKKFINDKGADKSNIFLLSEVLKEGSRICGVAESQFNALSAYQ
jgi:DNA primase